jgi:hypothetical protein
MPRRDLDICLGTIGNERDVGTAIWPRHEAGEQRTLESMHQQDGGECIGRQTDIPGQLLMENDARDPNWTVLQAGTYSRIWLDPDNSPNAEVMRAPNLKTRRS